MSTAIRWACAVMLLLAMGAAHAQRAEGSRAAAQGVYQAEVPVRSQTESERNSGFARALVQVLSKISGERSPQQRPGVGEELRNAKDYVAGYDYRQDEGVSASGAPTFSTMLVVRFKPDKVNELAQLVGVPVWPEPRPKPVLWLALDDGSGPRLVALKQVNVARSALDRAQARGYRLGLPQGNAAEQAIAGAIWRGDTAAVARISRAYRPPMQLIGKVQRAGSGWRADWIFVDNGRVLARRSETGADARRVIATGADVAGDALARKYARATVPASPPGDFRLVFSGIHSGSDYLRLVGYLERHSLVGTVVPVSAEGEQAVFVVHLKSGLAGFRRVIERDGVIAADQAEGGDAAFRLR
ncbi:DUF2066 domain-containing protein [Luteimonas sp. e5]